MLEPGRFLGQVVQRRSFDWIIATESVYAARRAEAAHAHRNGYLSYLLDGSYEERVGVERRSCAVGSLILHPAGEVHEQRSGPGGARTLNVELLPGGPWPRVGQPVPRSLVLTGAALDEIAIRARACLASADPVADARLERLVPLLLGIVATVAPPSGDWPRWLTDAHELLTASFPRVPTNLDLASRVGVHPAHLCETWRTHLGTTVRGTVRVLRVQRAIELLRDPMLGLTRVAHAAGFADQPHLTREFKRATGSTPGIWRAPA